ncbi:MAG: hypothetical protein Ct9H300mP28_34270 [Pseudomonadota bacterium]|nr:MAG: hypothetical protein Ct9H300mP28_34270 [Pseudomonadota bacterium]
MVAYVFLYENAAMVLIFAIRRAELISRFSIDALPDASCNMREKEDTIDERITIGCAVLENPSKKSFISSWIIACLLMRST